jgi:mannosyltransferase OCH1-like enzyme
VRVVILVPRRVDNGHRDALWAFAREWWERDVPDFEIFEGFDNSDLPFNRALAINRAAEMAGDWDVAHVIDGDVLADPRAVRQAVELAHREGMAVVAHNERMMLTPVGTEKVMSGYRGPWEEKGMVRKTWPDSVSCSVAVPRTLWDAVGGFDHLFEGWGFEDTAFVIAAETFSGKLLLKVNSQVWHLHHESNPDARIKSPSYQANLARVERYRAARFDRDAVQALLNERDASSVESMQLSETRIPRILHRTVPASTSVEVEGWWSDFQRLHPGWVFHTWRDPLNPADWPLTGDIWSRCQNGAQRAGLIRLEALVTHGGVYVDSDVQPFRSLEPLLHTPAFAAWEDAKCVPDAVLACEPGHPAFVQMLEKARSVIEGGGDAWQSGPGVTTETLPGRADVLVLPPGCFYAVHYLEKDQLNRTPAPYEFARHRWHGSWLSPAQQKSMARRQRR